MVPRISPKSGFVKQAQNIQPLLNRKIMSTVFWDCMGVLLTELELGTTLMVEVNCETLKKFWDQSKTNEIGSHEGCCSSAQ